MPKPPTLAAASVRTSAKLAARGRLLPNSVWAAASVSTSAKLDARGLLAVPPFSEKGPREKLYSGIIEIEEEDDDGADDKDGEVESDIAESAEKEA
mmetsp:Transcript_41332/g.81250  ORF Transcript_41332/g.81250 Transcript_41332/m.81250 type:complete len:96 (+) Transcript_41332:567-854(+)|eukprot:CAMPEP_0171602994 /NCGR_PEP_ID=MMETSP0990-20121206/5772_1 /TAXON_ID=483369 /ORGANISM="non described non described, Strain CCMP2098" /LENGTH=95 /DNA_ID=CAMNT_0012165293 /DNA_START=547 /DNA_END=834 /DNA_ORIENTATION=-